MKKSFKILTLAAFVLVGLISRSHVFAFSFTSVDGYIGRDMCGGYGGRGLVWGSTTADALGCGSGEKFSTYATYPDVYAYNGGATLTGFGTFTTITDFTFEIDNTTDSSISDDDGYYVTCYDGTGSHTQSAGTQSIPPGTNDVTWTLTSPVTCDSSTVTRIDIGNNLNFSDHYDFFFVGTNANTNTQLQLGDLPMDGLSTSYMVKFAFNGNFFTPVAITSPPLWVNQFGLDYEIPVDGTCPENGTSTLVVSWPGALYTTEPVTCTDNLFSVSIPTRDLGTFTAVFTSLCYLPSDNPLCTASYTYTVSPDFYNWNFSVDYPHPAADGITYNLQTQNLTASSTFPFRYVYLVPTGTPLSAVDINITQYSNNTFTAPLSGGVNATSSLADLTYGVPLPQTEFEDSHVVVGDDPTYYKVTMWNNGVMRAFVLLVVNKDNSIDGQVPALPALNTNGQTPCNMDWFGQSICWLVVPSQSDMQDIVDTEEQELSNVVPFSYVQQAVTQIQDVSITTSSPSALALVIPAALNNGATSTSDLPIFEQTADTAPTTNFMSGVRPYLIAAIWIYFVYFCIREIGEHWKGK